MSEVTDALGVRFFAESGYSAFEMVFAFLSLLSSIAFAQNDLASLRVIEVNPILEMTQLLKDLDTDRDLRITVDDLRQTRKIIPRFKLRSTSGELLSVEGVYHLSNLLQELKEASDANQDAPSKIRGDRIYENPVTRTSRLIREMYWDSLTRIIDRDHLYQVLGDSKVKSKVRYLYVPFDDEEAFDYYSKASRELPELNFKVVRLQREITPEYVKTLSNAHGLLALKMNTPYVVPGGRFNEMYGWDSYFEGLGLLADQRVDLAKAMVDHFVYEIRHYGKILNANRTYYLTRSQPPFLAPFIRVVREALPSNNETKGWLKEALTTAIQEYETVWMGKERLTDTGLSRYAGAGYGIPPEVEPGHFNAVLAPYAKKRKLSLQEFVKRYDSGTIREPKLDEFFRQDRAVRESGHDTTYRWRVHGEDRAADFVTVDLNSLLYKTELEIAYLIDRYFDGKLKSGDREWTAAQWREKAANRKKLMLALLWDPDQKLFFDYDFIRKRRSNYVSAATLYPLWAWDPSRSETRFLSRPDEKVYVQNALNLLEKSGGLTATAEKSLRGSGDVKRARQWEYPNGWAPHQMLAWIGLEQSGWNAVADRLIYKWLYMITRNAMDYQGTVPEKYDVVKRSHQVFAEYGNVGTDFSYITREGFGWMNASYQVGLQKLSKPLKERLEQVIPPEWVEFK